MKCSSFPYAKHRAWHVGKLLLSDAPVSPTLDLFFFFFCHPLMVSLAGRVVKLPRHFQWRELVDSSALSSAVQAGFSGLAAWACRWALPPALTRRLDSLAAGGRPHGHSRPLTGSLRYSGSG